MMAPRSRGGRWVVVPDGHVAAQARLIARRGRRRQTRIMLLLSGLAIGTAIWAFVGPGVALSVHLGVDVILVAYCAVVYEARRRQAEQRRKVRSLARHPLSAPRASLSELDRESIAL